MKKIHKIFTMSAVIFLLFFPTLSFVHAQPAVDPNDAYGNDYVLLAPLPHTTEGDCTDSSDFLCQTNLSTYIKGAFNLIVGLAAVLAFIMLTYGGVLYMTSDAITGKSQGKEYIENALWGLLLVIASYVILYTINPNMVSFNLNMAPPQTTAAPTLNDALAAATAAGIPTPGQPMTQNQINANALIAQQLGQTANPCAQGQSTGCVNLIGLQQDTITGVQNLKALCSTNSSDSCPNVAVLSGTDGAHDVNSCHYKGTCVDVGPTSDINKTITGGTPGFVLTTPPTSPNQGCEIYTDSAGNTYLYENTGDKCGGSVASSGTHWHITYK